MRGIGCLLAIGCAAGCTEPSFAPDAASEPEAGEDASPSSPDASDEPSDADGSASTVDAACDACTPDTIDAASEADAAAAQDAETASEDAQQPPPDAQSEGQDAGLDPTRAVWAGRYAARSFVFGYQSPYRTSGRYLSLVQIQPTPEGGLVLIEDICRFESSLSVAGVTASFAVDYPAGTQLTAPLTFDAEQFSSALGSARVGYGDAPPECAGAANARLSGAKRPWLVDNACTCPSDAAALPSSAQDCRVIDSDGDSAPGHTFRGDLQGSKSVVQGAQEQRLRLLNGFRVGDRLFAQRQFSDATRTLSCTVDGVATRIENCALGTAGPCAPVYNKVELYPIAAQYGCSDIIQREQGWFTSPEPPFPTGCTTQTAMAR